MLVKYFIIRLFQITPTLLLLSMLVFSMVHLAPGDPINVMVSEFASDELRASVRAQYNLDKPLVVQYGLWMKDVFTGDLGTSVRFGRPVSKMIMERVPVTLLLAVGATLFSTIIALPGGIVSAVKPGSVIDVLSMLGTSLAISLPNFFTAIVFILIFGVMLRWLPIAGYVSPTESILGCLRHLIMPVVSLGLLYTALLARLVRSEMLDVIHEDYVRTARSKGIPEFRVYWKHALRNALITPINVVSLNFARLLGGSIIIEMIFALPGLGQLLFTGVKYRDFPVIQGITLVVGLIFLLSSLIADLVASLVDPRIVRGL